METFEPTQELQDNIHDGEEIQWVVRPHALGRLVGQGLGFIVGAVVLGVFVVGLSLLWATTVPTSLVLGLTESTLIEQHRWALVAAAVPIPLGAAWFAVGLDLV